MPYLQNNSLPLAIAHRGGSLEAPENTMAAFQNARQLGFRYIETDVRLTSDGVLIIFHDEKLDRLTGNSKKVSDLTWVEISKLKVSGEPIPRADKTLGMWDDIYWNIDPKETACVRPLAKLIEDMNLFDRVCVGSFRDRHLKMIQKLLDKKINISAGSSRLLQIYIQIYIKSKSQAFKNKIWGKAESDERKNKKFISKQKIDCLQIPPSYGKIKLATQNFIESAHAMNLPVHFWTINDAKEINQLLDLGADGIMTDAPSLLKEIYIHRNLWNSVD